MIYRERRKTVKQCPSCRAVIDDDARFCIFCAESVDEKRRIEIKRFDGKNSLRAAVACVCAAVVVFTVTVGAMSVRRNSAPPRLPEPESETAVTVSAVPDQPQEDTPDESTEPAGAVTDATDTPFAPADETTDTDAAGTPAADTSPADVPETTEPETTKPETTKPETTKPESTKPETTKPEAIKPEATKPEATAPDTTRPETTKPETTIPATTSPVTTPPETTVNETTSPESAAAESTAPEITVDTKRDLRLVSSDEFAGGPPDDPEGKEYLWLEMYRYGGWSCKLYGLEDPMYGSSKQIEDLYPERLVFFKTDGSATATYTADMWNGEDDLLLLKYSLGTDAGDTEIPSAMSGATMRKRPAGWRGMNIEYGFDLRIDENDPYSDLPAVLDSYGGLGNVGDISYEYCEFYIESPDHTIKVTVEEKKVLNIPADDRLIQLIPYFFDSATLTYAEYVD